MRPLHLMMLVILALALIGCGDRAEVVDSQTDLHLSGNWNDSDSRVVSESLAKAVAQAPWVAEFRERMGRPPVLRVGRIFVRTRALDDLVEPAVFTNDIQRALIASGQVRVVADRREAEIQRDERTDVAVGAAQPVITDGGLAANVVLTGTLLTQDDRVLDKGVSGTYRQVKFYQLDLAVSDLATTEIL
jgi:penicillin-binding protein activator